MMPEKDRIINLLAGVTATIELSSAAVGIADLGANNFKRLLYSCLHCTQLIVVAGAGRATVLQ